MTTGYKAFSARIRSCPKKDLHKLKASLDRFYQAGIFSVPEFRRLDDMIAKRKLQ